MDGEPRDRIRISYSLSDTSPRNTAENCTKGVFLPALVHIAGDSVVRFAVVNETGTVGAKTGPNVFHVTVGDEGELFFVP